MREISLSQLTFNPFDKISKEWFLIGAKSGEKANAMTASWGMVGHIWKKDVFMCLIRPARFTYPIAEEGNCITLSFLDESFKKELTYFGRTSGKNEDKLKYGNLTPVCDGEFLYFDEASLVLCGRKVYCDDVKCDKFIDKSLLSNYNGDDFHRMYICEIEKALTK